jgi:hypothetical protein
LFSLSLIASALALAALTPAHAQIFAPPEPYLHPEFPNYLSPPGPAVCHWYDECWYLIARGPPIAVTPVAPPVRPPVKAKH